MTHGIRARHFFAAALIAICGFGSASCASFNRPRIVEEGDFLARARVKVEAAAESARPPRGRARPQPAPANLSALQRHVFMAEAEAAFPANASGGVQRLAVARAEALRAAHRELAKQIAQYELDGRPLAELVPSGGAWSSDLAKIIETQAQTEFSESAEAARARATLPGEAVHRGLGLEPMRSTELARPAEETPAAANEEARKRAERLAVNAAREMLREQIYNTPASGGQTLRSIFARRPPAADRLEAMIEETQPAEVNFTPDGFCEAALVLPRARVAELLN